MIYLESCLTTIYLEILNIHTGESKSMMEIF